MSCAICPNRKWEEGDREYSPPGWGAYYCNLVAAPGGALTKAVADGDEPAPTWCAINKAPAQAADRALASPDEWKPLTGPGQVKVGTRLRFTTGGKAVEVSAQEILEGGTDKEEIVYDLAHNYYFITSMAVAGNSHAKNVEYLASPASKDGGQQR